MYRLCLGLAFTIGGLVCLLAFVLIWISSAVWFSFWCSVVCGLGVVVLGVCGVVLFRSSWFCGFLTCDFFAGYLFVGCAIT